MKYNAFQFPPEEKYVPRLESNLIPKRLAHLKKVDFGVEQFIINREKQRDARIEQKRELRPDTTQQPSQGLGEACWSLINQCMP